VFGDATLATREKGRQVVETLVERVLNEIEALRLAPVPERRP
jgi:creatinine amidohydrolase/Fe(II)-dependent formamide hydrolase-like protein